VVVWLSLSGCSRADKADGGSGGSTDDAEMKAAIAAARARLPEFWKSLDHPAEGEYIFSLKVKISTKDGTEEFWVNEIKRQDGMITAKINTEPNTLQSLKLGQRIDVADDQILDWMFFRKGKIVGKFTLRPQMKKMSPEQLERFKITLESP
jgi:uncharacterized protein YegJ (DUF2314 family)